MEQDERTISNLKKFLKLGSNDKQCSKLKMCLVNGRIKAYNIKNNTKHFISWVQVGKANLYTWTIHENWNNVQLGFNF